jgi:hypothetical protein
LLNTPVCFNRITSGSDSRFWRELWIQMLNTLYILNRLCGHLTMNITWSIRSLTPPDKFYDAKNFVFIGKWSGFFVTHLARGYHCFNYNVILNTVYVCDVKCLQTGKFLSDILMKLVQNLYNDLQKLSYQLQGGSYSNINISIYKLCVNNVSTKTWSNVQEKHKKPIIGLNGNEKGQEIYVERSEARTERESESHNRPTPYPTYYSYHFHFFSTAHAL